jgi:hypothetical protein
MEPKTETARSFQNREQVITNKTSFIAAIVSLV